LNYWLHFFERLFHLGMKTLVAVEGMDLTRKIILARNRQQLQTKAHVKFWDFVKIPKSEI
jgi:hypothetical protein